MNDLSSMLPTIIREHTQFSCFNVPGTLDTVISDEGTNEFPARITIATLVGGGVADLLLKGNETIEHKIEVPVIGEITIKVVISNWQVSNDRLSFHVKGEASKWIIGCEFINKTLSGNRYKEGAFQEALSLALEEVEKTAKA